MTRDSLLIYAPVPLYRSPSGALLLEDQACNGLRLWSRHFSKVIVMMPLAEGKAPPQWRDLLEALGEDAARIEMVPLPEAWRVDKFYRALPKTRALIRETIARADRLSFAIGGLFGDWGAVACREAYKMGRPYAVWTDRVESEVVRRSVTSGGHWRARLRAWLTWRPMARLEREVISRATLGLFHGRETFDFYAPFARQPEIVHDIHLTRADHITPEALAAKQRAAREGTLHILYAGRMDPMKGPSDWALVLERLAARGVDFRAIWLGDGSEMPALRERVLAAGMQDKVELPGMVTDREAVFQALREAHILMFCHKTPESPRILIESLVSGTPIIGYEGAFARDLISENGGGALVGLGDMLALSDVVTDLAADRERLVDMMGRAAKDGSPYEDAEVFHHRSALITHYLPSQFPAPRG